MVKAKVSDQNRHTKIRGYAILSATTQRAFRPTVSILRMMVVALNMA